MNGYVCKPYSKSELVKALKKWSRLGQATKACVNQTMGARASIDNSSAAPAPDTDDKQSIRALRPALYAKLMNLYLEHSPTLVSGMQRSLRVNDFENLRFSAHNLKSSSANVEAMAIARLCEQLETAAKASDQPSCAAAIAEINMQLERFADAARPSLEAASAMAS